MEFDYELARNYFGVRKKNFKGRKMTNILCLKSHMHGIFWYVLCKPIGGHVMDYFVEATDQSITKNIWRGSLNPFPFQHHWWRSKHKEEVAGLFLLPVPYKAMWILCFNWAWPSTQWLLHHRHPLHIQLPNPFSIPKLWSQAHLQWLIWAASLHRRSSWLCPCPQQELWSSF